MPAPKTTRRVFAPTQCHWREGGLGDKTGKPVCKKPRVSQHANLCRQHEALWQAAARERYDAKRKAAIIAEYEAAKA
jgi:hypothetical protein